MSNLPDPPETQELRNHRIEYINQRWKQLHALEKECAEVAIKYLLLTNSGGAIAVLSFMGSSEKARSSHYAVAALASFVVGVILVGVFNILRYYRVANLFNSWRRDSEKYFERQIDWKKLTDADNLRSKAQIAAHFAGNLSFVAFLVGCLLGTISFFK
ncbi:MAG: hypothetical protein ABSE97_08760 [Verrucomicrobiota bacterium]